MTDTKTNTACRVIIVDDDEDFAGSIADILKSHGYPCAVVLTAEDACQVAERFEAQVALVDVCLGSESGLDVVAELKQIQPDVLCVMVSAYADTESAMQALHEGAQAYLQKPVDPRELLETMEDCSERLQNDHRKAAAEQTLREAHAQLERRNQRLAELRENAERFVDDVSHEFRTPLTVIKAYTSMLADGLGGPVTGEQAEYLGMTGKAVEDLTRMVNDLLDSSRLESSLRRVDRRRCKVAEIIRSVRPMRATQRPGTSGSWRALRQGSATCLPTRRRSEGPLSTSPSTHSSSPLQAPRSLSGPGSSPMGSSRSALRIKAAAYQLRI